jgi:ABC-type nitrate/sulfonate/bicarbonate transport system permease component
VRFLRSRGAQAFLFIALLLLVWSYSLSLGVHGSSLLPSPWMTLETWWLDRALWLPHAWATGRMMVLSVGAALLASLPIAWWMHCAPRVQVAVESLFFTLQCLPLFVLTPVLVAFLGWGGWTVWIPSSLAVLFPLCMSLFKAVRSVPKAYLELFSTFPMHPWTIFWNLQLPYALPSLFAGLRVAMAGAGTAVLAAEFAGSQEGLGVLIQESRRNFDLAMSFACILTLSILMASLIGFCIWAERTLLKERRHVALA